MGDELSKASLLDEIREHAKRLEENKGSWGVGTHVYVRDVNFLLETIEHLSEELRAADTVTDLAAKRFEELEEENESHRLSIKTLAACVCKQVELTMKCNAELA